MVSWLLISGLFAKPAYTEPAQAGHVVRIVNNTIRPAEPKTWDEVIAPQLAKREQQIKQAEEQKAREAAEVAQQEIAREAEQQEAQPAQVASQSAYLTPTITANALTGTLGYASPFGNCVLEPGINNPGFGNPSDWPVTSTTPWIGATALFTYNHTGVVTGIWGNGDLEIRHQNFQGGQTRFSINEFRGFR